MISEPLFQAHADEGDEAGEIPEVGKPKRRRVGMEPKQARRRAKLREGMSNLLVIAEDVDQLTFEADRIRAAFQPRNAWQDWLVGEIATSMFRITRCQRIERKLRDMASLRAIDLWAEDQALAVENLAVKLPFQPSRVVAQLRDTPAGIDWLILRWEILTRAEGREWTEDDRDLACLLLGGNGAIDPTEAGFVRARIVELRELAVKVEEADEITRSLVEADLCDEKVPHLNRLRRYVRSLQRQMKWYVDQFHVEHPDRWDDPRRQPGHISYDLMEAQRHRKTTYSFAEPHPAEPVADETKPFESVADPTTPPDETKPFEVVADPITPDDETKPLAGRRSRRSNPALAGSGMTAWPTDHDPLAQVQDYATERGRNHSREPRAGEHPRAYALRLRAARRQTNRVLKDQDRS